MYRHNETKKKEKGKEILSFSQQTSAEQTKQQKDVGLSAKH
jgi:hypothetical protein